MMDYSINPGENSLRELSQRVETAIQSYDHALDIETVEVFLGWQPLERSHSVIPGAGSINVIVDPSSDPEGLEKDVLRAMLELEFREKADYEIVYGWQETAKIAYVERRASEITGEELEGEEFDVETVLEFIENEVDDFTSGYSEAARAGKALAASNEAESFLEMKRSDIAELVEQE